MENNTKFFSVKICSSENPLIVKIPQQELSGKGKEVKIEVSTFFWISPLKTVDGLKMLKLKINPTFYTGNYDENGKLQPYSVFICPSHNHHSTDAIQFTYTFSPAKSDLLLIKPTPVFDIEFYDENDNLEKFTQTDPISQEIKNFPYFICINISY